MYTTRDKEFLSVCEKLVKFTLVEYVYGGMHGVTHGHSGSGRKRNLRDNKEAVGALLSAVFGFPYTGR